MARGKQTPAPAGSRQARLAELRAAEQRKRTRKRSALLAVGVVVLVIVAMVAVRAIDHSRNNTPATKAPLGVTQRVTSIPAAAFDRAGAPPGQLLFRATGAPSLTVGGKPRVLYIGAEYCPYCAAERWAVTAALARFGRFHNLHQTLSSSTDVYPSTPTLSFHGASYTSPYLVFSGFEVQDRTMAPLDALSKADQALWQKYDTAQFIPPLGSNGGGSIPFVDDGNRFLSSSASYSPGLFAGMTHAQVARAIASPTTPVGRAVLGTANEISAALCQLTGGKPGSVCDSTGVRAGAAKLPA